MTNDLEQRGRSVIDSLRNTAITVRQDVSLRGFTTFGVGGPALVLGEPNGEDELIELVSAARSAELPTVVIGQGSNLLVADSGVGAVVIVLRGSFADIHPGDSQLTALSVGAAVKLPVLARRSAAMGLSGLEWAVGVPGSVGGAVKMNAGGHGSDMAANLLSIRVLDSVHGTSVEERPAAELNLAYRSSAIAPTDIVTGATFQLTPGNVAQSEAELREIVRWRREHQPGGANCGSVFTNPQGDSAGRLIEAAGLKGHRIGTASVSTKHANFIQADPDARQQDISALIVYVQMIVKDRFGVELHAEVKTLGITSEQRI
jgi:UDP-N-acetylmuramate dehydrogenase